MADFENIELRSEKVRNIIGKVPPGIIRTGITDIILILLVLILATFFIPYPESVKASAVMTGTNGTNIHARLFIPYRYVTKIKKGMPVEMEMEGYEATRYGYTKGLIESCNDTVTVVNGNNYFTVEVTPDVCYTRYPLWKGMKGTASILISDKSIAHYILPHLWKRD